MSNSMKALIETLDKASEIYTELLELAHQKRTLIQNEDLKALNSVTDTEQGLVVSLYKLEEMRAATLEQLLSERGLAEVTTVTELARHLEGAEKARLLASKETLLAKVKNVGDEVHFNSRMLEERLERIQLNLHLLTETGMESGTYDRKTDTGDAERRNLFDVRV